MVHSKGESIFKMSYATPFMDKESFERSSAKIEHDPSIKRYTEFHEKELKQNRKDIFRIFGFICSILSFSLFCITIRQILDSPGPDSILFKLIRKDTNIFVLSAIYFGFRSIFNSMLYSVFYFTLMVFRMLFRKKFPEKIFIPNILGKFSSNFAFVLAILTGLRFSQHFSTSFFKHYITPTVPDSGSLIETGFIMKIADKLILTFAKILLIFLLRDIVIYTLNFNIHYQYYNKRIQKNTEKITLLRLMNDAINAGYTGDIDVISTRLMQVLTMGRPVPNDGSSPLVNLNDLQKFFGEATALKIFEYCNREGEMGEEEIKGFYVSTLVEQTAIVKSIEQHNSTVENFRNILNIAVFAIICYLFKELIPEGAAGPLVSSIGSSTFFMGLIFSTNYTFSDSIKAFTSNICFAFFVRPYEVGDIIYFSDCLYKVKEINLMTTVLFDGCKCVIVPNQRISGEAIKNLRINRVFDVEYKCMFSPDNFEAQSKVLVDRINNYIKKKSSEFHKNPFYKGSPVTVNGMVESTLVVKFNCDVADIEILNERRTKFFSVLMRLLKEQ